MNTRPRLDAGGRLSRPPRGEAGESAPLTMVLGVVLIIIPTFLAVLVLPSWEARTVAAHDAARIAARTLSSAATWGQGTAAADRAVAELATNNGVPAADVTATYSGSLNRGDTITAVVVIAIPTTYVPGVGTFGSFHFTATDTVNVPQYRNGP